MRDEVCCGAATVSPNAWYAPGLCMAGMRLFGWFGGAAIPIFAVHHSGGEEFVMSLINLSSERVMPGRAGGIASAPMTS
jgi:hypothetical protein